MYLIEKHGKFFSSNSTEITVFKLKDERNHRNKNVN